MFRQITLSKRVVDLCYTVAAPIIQRVLFIIYTCRPISLKNKYSLGYIYFGIFQANTLLN